MKKSAEIKGLPIISIMDGVELGKIKSLILNPEQGSVDFFTIEHEDWEAEGKAIPFKKVIGIGEYALTIEDEGSIIDLNEIPIASDLLNRKTKIEDVRLITRKGQLVGTAVEYVVDEETGKISALEVLANNEHVTVKSEYIVTYGKDIIIVKEEARDQIGTAARTKITETAAEVKEADGLAAIEQQQAELLLGKTVQKDIKGGNRGVIIPSGTVLSQQDIQSAREAGPEVLVELSMHSEG
ncbi:uncharacterized protein YrrD [Bacillus ectoiniformans]|uniref:PRC-barrel domain-containing protein n=1 Tax=Bacillus ectoiniformans TaxID=1494429 RepID=UPI00195D1DA1|nr:PRC-barrel domain-containing protein [Bacillus ectoiniformans]MBM7648934.1 uncharacterized protein YrrD [Bacillus ectoiniformans]